jgi:hypothetical protein
MSQDAMERSGSRVITLGFDQFATSQELERRLDRAFRKARFLGERAQARLDWFPFSARGLAEEMEVDEIRSRLAIVADDVSHENVEDVIVDGDGLAESRHGESKKEELKSGK